MTDPSGRSWTDGLARWVSAGVAVSGAIFAGVQFLEAKSIWRLERTTPYFERYESGEIGAARRKLAASLKAYREQFDQIERGGVTPSDRDAMMTSIFTSDPAVGDSFDMIADFFQGMRVCVEAQLCDRAVAGRYFASSDAGDLWALAKPYVRYRRENNPSFADAFESFLGPKGASPPAPAPLPPQAGNPLPSPAVPAASDPPASGRRGVLVPAAPAGAAEKPDPKSPPKGN